MKTYRYMVGITVVCSVLVMPVRAQGVEADSSAAAPGAAAVMVDAKTQEGETDSAAELAKKLANPVASLISVPLQYNYDENFGPNDDGSKSVLNIQPVLPFSLSKEWNLILRTIVPLIDQEDIPYKGLNRLTTVPRAGAHVRS